MKKKIILPIVAAAAFAFTSGGAINADASTINTTVEKQVYVYQNSNLNQDQINNLLQKYLKGFNINLDQLTKQITVQNQAPVQKETTKPAPAPQTQKEAAKPAPAPQAQKEAAKPAPAPQAQKETVKPATTAPTASQVSAFEQQVVDLTNQERAKAGLPALKLDTELSKVARTKSQDMKNKGYFSHTSPTYGSPFDMMKQFGISYKSAGENIAMGQTTPQQVVTAWMNSEGHRANILNGSYTHIGVGHVTDGNYWTQMFISK